MLLTLSKKLLWPPGRRHSLPRMSGLIPDAGPDAEFEFTLDRVGWFAENVVWLGPRDPAPFSALTSLVFTAFPSCPPYGGQHAEVIPHLTIGHIGGQQALHAAAESVGPCLPIEATAAEVILMAGPHPGTPGTPPGQWRTIVAFPVRVPGSALCPPAQVPGGQRQNRSGFLRKAARRCAESH